MFRTQENAWRQSAPFTSEALRRLLPLLENVPDDVEDDGVYCRIYMQYIELGDRARQYDEACALIRTVPTNQSWGLPEARGHLPEDDYKRYLYRQFSDVMGRLCASPLMGTMMGREALIAAANRATSMDSFLGNDNVTPFRKKVCKCLMQCAAERFRFDGEKITA